ncbi:hypothetical protein EMCRGX_G014476 [Ephydatia muelleri]
MGNGFRSLKIHLAKFTKIVWKPEGIGVEYKNLADAGTGILLHLEIQEDMSTNIPKHTALLLRLTKMLHGQGHIVYGDSAFASVEIATALYDHLKKQWKLNPETGLSESVTRPVPRTRMIKSYFEAACAIDVHNHLQQYGLALEQPVGTHD